MSQIVLDDQLDVQKIFPRLQGWQAAVRLQDLRPGEHILDDRVPELLMSIDRPTFVTIDRGFFKRRLCHSRYCILCFMLGKDAQDKLPPRLRQLFRLPEFRTRAARMGKVARIGRSTVVCWEAGRRTTLSLPPVR